MCVCVCVYVCVFTPRRREDEVLSTIRRNFCFNVQSTGAAGGAGKQGHGAGLACMVICCGKLSSLASRTCLKVPLLSDYRCEDREVQRRSS